MVMSIIVGPERTQASSTRNNKPPAPSPSSSTSHSTIPADPFDRRILDYVGGERIGFAVRSWTLVNDITKAMKPSSEAERRRIVKALLQRLKLLLHSKVIRRAGRHHIYLHVEGQPAPQSPFTRNIPRRRRRVRRRQVSRLRAASLATAQVSASASLCVSHPSQFSDNAHTASFPAKLTAKTTSIESRKTKSAPAPTPAHPDDVRSPQLRAPSLAVRFMLRLALLRCGSQLARWRWLEPRKWTGYLHGERCWVGRRVMMSDGMRGAIIDARRGVARVFADERLTIAESRLRKLHERELVLLKLPQAVLLGSLKRGRNERPSQRKAEACRRNGCCPVRPGSRPRGRPRKPVP